MQQFQGSHLIDTTTQAAIENVCFSIAGCFRNIEINNGLNWIKHKQHIKILMLQRVFSYFFPILGHMELRQANVMHITTNELVCHDSIKPPQNSWKLAFSSLKWVLLQALFFYNFWLWTFSDSNTESDVFKGKYVHKHINFYLPVFVYICLYQSFCLLSCLFE